jgi:bisphosphoglycerate-independent phosphoglycerate mutase (AlkP superfamily)
VSVCSGGRKPQSDGEGRAQGILADVAPTVLRYMGLPVPAEMTGNPLL